MSGDVRRVAFAGDWHQNERWGAAAIGYAKDHDADVIVHAGDYGYVYPRESSSPRSTTPCAGPGSSCGPSKATTIGRARSTGRSGRAAFAGSAPGSGTSRAGTGGSGLGKTFLGCGGAVSVDRPRRTPGVSWWPEEAITGEDVARCVDGGPVDVLVAHDCPAGVVIPGIDDRTGPPPFPPAEIERSNEHRRLVRRIVDGCRPGLIVHGHYHVAYETDQHLMGYPARVVGLDCDGSELDRNVRVIDLEELPGVPRG